MNDMRKGILHEDTDEDDYRHSINDRGKGLLNEELDEEDYEHSVKNKVLDEDTDEDGCRQSVNYVKGKSILHEHSNEDDSTQVINDKRMGVLVLDANKDDHGHNISLPSTEADNYSKESPKQAPTTPKKNPLGVSEHRMAYDELGPLLKRCLLFLSVFPANETINKRSLIYWWIGEGLVKSVKDLTAEQIGEECFQMLLRSGLIRPIFKRHKEIAMGCVVEPKIRDVLISIAASTGFFAFDSQKQPTINTAESIRACLVAIKKDQVVAVSLQPNLDNVLSLFNVNARYLKLEKSKLSRLKSVTVLQIGRWQNPIDNHMEMDDPKLVDCHIEIEDTKFLESLRIMQNLKYLSLQGISTITALPNSCKNLASLQILDLRGCHHLEALPNEIGLMRSLTHLDVSECPFLERMPKGIDKLSELQVLKGFVLAETKDDSSCKLSELTVLRKLRKLTIKVVATIAMDELRGFSSLRSLTISWGQVTVSSTITLPTGLEKLDLQRIPQEEKPSWLKPEDLQELKKLYIRGGKLKSLHLETTKGWNVETLRLRFLKELKWNYWSEVRDAFQSLACVEVYKCPKLNPESLPPSINKDGVWIKKKEES